MIPTRAVNISVEPFDVLIDRRTEWGNGFLIGRDGTREAVIAKFRLWLPKQHHLIAQLHRLQGKRLGCHCRPLPCHGDVLAEFADADYRLRMAQKT